MADPVPTHLARTDDRQLCIEWSDGLKQTLPMRLLRDACQCATCMAEESSEDQATGSLPVLTAAQAQPLKILGMKPVGNYAYSIAFSDGHTSGIFTFELLRSLSVDHSDS